MWMPWKPGVRPEVPTTTRTLSPSWVKDTAPVVVPDPSNMKATADVAAAWADGAAVMNVKAATVATEVKIRTIQRMVPNPNWTV